MINEKTWSRDIGDELSIKVEEMASVEKGLVIVLTGRIDTYNSQDFTGCIQSVIEFLKYIIFDFSGIHYISSTGIGAFVTFYKIINNNGGSIVFTNIQSQVLEIFEVLGFGQLFMIKSSLDEAVEFLKKPQEKQETVLSLTVQCMECGTVLKINKSGWFRCPKCKTLFSIDKNGNMV